MAVTRDEFEAYVRVQESGVTNMFDANTVSALSGLARPKLIEIMEKIKENPSIVDAKDKHQSQWSREIRDQVTEQSNKCLRYEMDINTSFREFYEKYLKKILE